MPQPLSQIYIHLVFSTKNRKNFISESIAPDLYSYMATVFHDECHSTAKLIGGVEDHIHALFNRSRTLCVADVVKTVKVSTSKWMKKQDPMLRLFEWQTGDGAFSVSRSNIGAVQEYIRNQREHHRRRSFKDEFRGLLNTTTSSTTNDTCGIELLRRVAASDSMLFISRGFVQGSALPFAPG